MKRLSPHLAILLILLFSGCASVYTSNSRPDGYSPRDNAEENEAWDTLIGAWYGKQKLKDGSIREWLTIRRDNGTYQDVFLNTFEDGSTERTEEFGEWGVSGGIYFLIFKGWIENGRIDMVDEVTPWTRDAYRIIELSNNAFHYESTETGDRFRVVRAKEGFSL